MTFTTPAGPLGTRLDASYAELSPQEQRAADFMRDHLADLAIYNASEVANLSGVSKATISRLYRRLGFENAEDLRDHVRALRSSGIPLAATQPSFDAQLAQDYENMRAAFAGLDLSSEAIRITAARRVLVIGFRSSYPLALHLRQQLAQARDNVSLAPVSGQSIGEELSGLTAADTVIVLGFRRRPAHFAALVDALEASPAGVILLTDAGGRRYADKVGSLIECSVDGAGGFDSYAAVSSVISALASAVLSAGLQHGRARITAIDELYRSLDEIEN